MRAYLDHAASTPLLDCARDALVEALGRIGNPSSLHASGRAARRAVEESRERVACSLGVPPGSVVFTSGGTEADNLAVKGLWWARRHEDARRRRVLVSRVEHHAVVAAAAWVARHEGAELVWLDVDAFGRVDPGQVAEEVARDPAAAALVAVMSANNEVGTLQPIAAIGEVCRAHDVALHVDAVQAIGSVPVDATLPTSMAISAHKLGGPPGAGALVIRPGVDLVPLAHGGGQERRLRSGTVDGPGIAAFAAALEHVVAGLPERSARLAGLREALVAGVLAIAPNAVLNGAPGTQGHPGIAHLSFPGCDGDALLMLLDGAGVDVSTGSACSAGVPEPSHVLLAMGVEPRSARSSLRISMGHSSTQADVDLFLQALPTALERARLAGQVRAGSRWAAAPAARS